MPNWLYATDSQTAEDLRNELLTSTIRKLGSNHSHEHQSSSRRRNGIKEELSRRIRLMEKIPDSHPREIFVYNDKGFKSFTPEVEEILRRDLLRKPQKVAVPKYLNYTRGMLKEEIEKGKKAQPVSKEVTKDQEEGDDQLKEEYEQLMEECGAMEAEHEQLMGKYRQLKKDHAELQKEHERTLHELSESKEKQAKAPEQKAPDAPITGPRDEVIKQPPVLEYKSFPPIIDKEAREAQEARERASGQVRDKEARDQQDAKIREWEEENFVKEMNKRKQELREERTAREQQRLRALPKDPPGAGRLDAKAEVSAPQVPRHSFHGGVISSEPTHQKENLGDLLQVPKTGYPNMQQWGPYQPKPVPLRQTNYLKSVSFDRPTLTPNTDQGLPAGIKSDPPQQSNFPKSVSADVSTRTPTMGQIFPAQQPPAQQPPVQQAPLQQSPGQHFPVQQRSAPLRQANDPRGFPYGPPTGTSNMGHSFSAQQRSAPLRQENEPRNVSFRVPTATATRPTGSGAPTLSSQSGYQLEIPLRSQGSLRGPESSNDTTSDGAGMAERVDRSAFIRRPDAP